MSEIQILKADGNVHCIPREGIVHFENENCWCKPVWDEQNKNEFQSGEANKKLFVHRTKKECEQ